MITEREQPKRRWPTAARHCRRDRACRGRLAVAVVAGSTFGSRRPASRSRSSDRRQRALNAIAASGGHILQSNNFVTIAHSDDAGFVARLYANGAWFVLDADGAGGCGAIVKRLANF